LKELSRGVRWLLGVIVVALVVDLHTAVVRGCAGPAERGAELSDVAIDRNVTLDEYAIRHENDSASRPGSASLMHLEVHLVAQAIPEDVPPEEPEPQEPEEPQPEEPEPEEPQPGGQTTADDMGVLLRRPFSPKESEALNAGVQEVIDESQLDVGPACEEDAMQPKCPLPALLFLPADVEAGVLTVEQEGPLSAETVARRLRKIFNGTRTRPLSPAGGKRQMVGATVNFNVSMTGFDDGRADVRWSLYSAGDNALVPRDWLRTQRALSLRGEANKDSASGEFWVPLPKAKGPFFIRLGVYDDDNTRLDYADTPRFR